MLSVVVFFLLLDFASSSIEFLTPTSEQEFPTNQPIPIKWKKVAGASNYSINGDLCGERILQTFKEPSKCKPRIWIGPLQEGYWNVSVSALNQAGDIIDSGSIGFRVCRSLPCPNGTETNEDTTCPVGQVLQYYTSPGYKVEGGSPDYTFNTTSEQECVDACTNNTRPNDPCKLFAPCKSVDFNNQTNQCEMYSAMTFPQGAATSTNDSTSAIHYEKVCINATLGERCQGPYFVEMQKNLDGGWEIIVTANSTNDCLEECIDSQARYGFVCQSGVMNTTSAIDNCVLSTLTRRNYPIDYVDSSTCTYFESGCAK